MQEVIFLSTKVNFFLPSGSTIYSFSPNFPVPKTRKPEIITNQSIEKRNQQRQIIERQAFYSEERRIHKAFEIEQNNWWYKSRRRLINNYLRDNFVPKQSRLILDVATAAAH